MRPERLPLFDYSGCHRYFVTCCTWKRQLLFDAATIAIVRDAVHASFLEHHFDVLAWVFMPDHVHWLVEGTREDANFRSAMMLVRQRAAIAYKRVSDTPLWQRGYHERVLRRDEDARLVADYILNNPVRRKLVESAVDYAHSWSITLSR
jgi:putative transposase